VGQGFRLALPTGAYYTWEGTVLEGTPIEPDERIGFDWQQRRAGIDGQLEHAIASLSTEGVRRARYQFASTRSTFTSRPKDPLLLRLWGVGEVGD
jgi:hypothetical protein